MFISEGVKILAKNMIENPLDWSQDEFTFRHRKSGISIWTANGRPFLEIEGGGYFNFFEKIYISRAIKKSCANKVWHKANSIN